MGASEIDELATEVVLADGREPKTLCPHMVC